MNYLYSILLGAIEALGEALPVAGSALLLMAKRTLNIPENMIQSANMDAALRWGVLLAAVVVFHKTLWGVITGFCTMVKGIFKGTFKWRKATKYQMMSVYLVIATLPMLVLAFVQNYYNVLGRWSEHLGFVGAMLLVSGGLVFIGSHSLCHGWTAQQMKVSHALKAGLFQAVACLPGLSRTGTTLSMVCNMGFEPATAMDFSFLLVVPTLLGTNLLRLGALTMPAAADFGILLVGFAAALAVGIAAFQLMKKLVEKDRFGWLMYYCLAAGIAAIVLNFAL